MNKLIFALSVVFFIISGDMLGTKNKPVDRDARAAEILKRMREKRAHTFSRIRDRRDNPPVKRRLTYDKIEDPNLAEY